MEESPFIGSSDSLDLVDSEEENGRKMETFSFLENSTKPKSNLRRCFMWSFVVVVAVLGLSAVFCAGFAVGHFTSGGKTTNSATAATTAPPTSSTATPPNCSTPNTFRDDICANPPVLVISLDGFWNGYFKRNITPVISSLGKEGVQADYVRSAFPTKTFPNHFTIVTGLYPESHGIVDNYFYDKILKDSFYLGNNDPKWWLGEPVWVAAAKQGLKSGTYFWPGSEVPIEGIYPTYYFKYDSSVPFEKRVQTVLEWLEFPSSERPQFMTLYVEEPDHSGHLAGPNSALVDAALGRVDEVVEDLLLGLKERDIYNCVNVIIVSDHGMTTSNSNELFHINEYIADEYDVTYPNYGVNMDINVDGGDEAAVQAVYESIQNISDAPFRAFYLEDLPLRLHAGHHNPQRYGDIYVVGDLGSYITSKSNSRPPLGEHGYDNNEVDMESIFLAHGPAFKEGYLAPGFDNIQIYDLLCALLKITPSANNGTFGALHHMLKPGIADTLPPVEVREGVEGVEEECLAQEDAVDCEACFCPTSCQDGHELIRDPDEVERYQSLHLPWGVPSGGQGGGACLLTNTHSVALYSTSLHIPLWVAFTLSNESTGSGSAGGGVQCYQRDPRTHSVQCSDYNTSQSDYTLTHLAPSTDGTYLPLLSNAVPQLSQFYNNVWSEWEQQLRQWTAAHGTIHVIAGSVLDSDKDGLRDTDQDYDSWLNGSGSVAVPSHFYSIVTRCVETSVGEPCPASSLDVLGVLIPHHSITPDASRSYIQFRLSTVWDIESVTGIHFFPALSPEQQARLSLHITPVLWD